MNFFSWIYINFIGLLKKENKFIPGIYFIGNLSFKQSRRFYIFSNLSIYINFINLCIKFYQFAGLRYTKGECSKVSYASETSSKSSRKENDVNTSASSHDSAHCREGAELISHRHTYTRDGKERYNHSRHSNVHFDYNHVVNDEHKTWHRKTCTFCGLHNHTFSKCWKRMAAHKRMRRERPPQQQVKKHVKKIWRKKTYYNHCDRSGNQRTTCWRLHPQQRLKGKASVHEPGETIVQQAKPPHGGDPFRTISEKWFLDMLAFHGRSFVNHLLHFKM